ncbi:DNA starvation/stationary phase protection protein [Mucilaginibacter sp.]|uniref:Dps family protein n=1 Tax=Mucilaginibacter sp. TaxID=1882438 RepID=UPI002627AF8C|nr:DNA starvation/stationary phase protection protein [Mucilaginibacter sp.]MDB5032705.1 starvation/stationary phase protection protein [Mucilaginibacter sp.]
MEANIEIEEEKTQAIADQLAKLLADELVLYTKTRNANLNIKGPDFDCIHLFFEEQYEELDELMDSVAERICMIGHYAPGTLAQLLQLSQLTDYSERENDSLGYLKELLKDHESIIAFLKGNIIAFADEYYVLGISDYITDLMETHEGMAWMIRAHLI